MTDEKLVAYIVEAGPERFCRGFVATAKPMKVFHHALYEQTKRLLKEMLGAERMRAIYAEVVEKDSKELSLTKVIHKAIPTA